MGQTAYSYPYLRQRPKIDDRLTIRTRSCAKLHAGTSSVGHSDSYHEFVKLD